MSRSWTLQGQLSPIVAVQFLGNAVILGSYHRDDGRQQNQSITVTRDVPPIETSSTTLDPSISAGRAVDAILPIDESGQYKDKQNHPASSLRCNCIERALERTFYRTFYNGWTDFVSVWNELAGRSTTMPADVPLILTNILEFENHALLKHHEAGEMYQHILLSLGRLPVSIFFNTGPRQNAEGNHEYRWVPVKIGREFLTPDDLLTVFPSYLSYRYEDLDRERGISVYSIDALLPLKSKVYLHSEENEHNIYTIEPSMFETDQFDTKGFNSTCLIIEKAPLPGSAGRIWRGACVYVRERRSYRLRCKPLDIPRFYPRIFMTFNCPLRLQQVMNSDPLPPNAEHVYSLKSIRSEYDVIINYGMVNDRDEVCLQSNPLADPLPKFKPLKKRSRKNVGTVVLLLALPMTATIAFPVEIFLMRVCNVLLAVFIGIVVGIRTYLLLNVFLTPIILKLAEWRYIRSFEVIARHQTSPGSG